MAGEVEVVVVSDDDGDDAPTPAPVKKTPLPPQWTMVITGVSALHRATREDPEIDTVHVLYTIFCGVVTTRKLPVPVKPWAGWVRDTWGSGATIRHGDQLWTVGRILDTHYLHDAHSLVDCFHKMMLETTPLSFYKGRLFWILSEFCGETTTFKLVRMGKQLIECHATLL